MMRWQARENVSGTCWEIFLEECKANYRIELLWNHIKDALGTPSSTPPTQTINLELLDQDIDVNSWHISQPSESLTIDSFYNTPTAGRGVRVDLYPTCIQAQLTVGASKSHEISNHITRHSAVNIGQIRSIQVTNCLTISWWVRWLMGLIVYSDKGFSAAIGTTPCKS
jgi:hypothetical protein